MRLNQAIKYFNFRRRALWLTLVQFRWRGGNGGIYERGWMADGNRRANINSRQTRISIKIMSY
jgi:hypothetical protein